MCPLLSRLQLRPGGKPGNLRLAILVLTHYCPEDPKHTLSPQSGVLDAWASPALRAALEKEPALPPPRFIASGYRPRALLGLPGAQECGRSTDHYGGGGGLGSSTQMETEPGARSALVVPCWALQGL